MDRWHYFVLGISCFWRERHEQFHYPIANYTTKINIFMNGLWLQLYFLRSYNRHLFMICSTKYLLWQRVWYACYRTPSVISAVACYRIVSDWLMRLDAPLSSAWEIFLCGIVMQFIIWQLAKFFCPRIYKSGDRNFYRIWVPLHPKAKFTFSWSKW